MEAAHLATDSFAQCGDRVHILTAKKQQQDNSQEGWKSHSIVLSKGDPFKTGT